MNICFPRQYMGKGITAEAENPEGTAPSSEGRPKKGRKPPRGMGPPKGMRMGPPPGMKMGMGMGPPPGLEIPEGMEIPFDPEEIKPDYRKWRERFFRMNLMIAFIVLILEIIIIIWQCTHGDRNEVLRTELFKSLIFPTCINFITVAMENHIMKKYSEREGILNFMVVVTTLILCTVVAATHHTISGTLTFFCIPVLVAMTFCDPRIILNTVFLGFFGMGLAMGRRFYVEYPDVSMNFILDYITALILLLLSGLVSSIIAGLMNEQRGKLIRATIEAKIAVKQAQNASLAKTSFLANMSHEIRTPINAVLGMNEMILREEKDQTIREYAMNIHSAGNSLLSIINDVLDISKIESGKIELVSVEYSLSSLINDSCNMVVSRANAKDLELKLVCDENLPHILFGDETRIRQIIVNLLTNAVKYTSMGSITLTIGGENQGGNLMLNISVRDTGMGISEENLKNLFGQFQRFDLTANRNIEGTGLGLSITKHLIELMNGKITVKSIVGIGSEFTVEIPQKIIDSTPVGRVNIRYTENDSYEYKQSFEAPGANILAVDDLPMNLMIIVNMLKATKVKVDTAESGRQCLELCRSKRYDIILMDHMMPEMDGIETHKELVSDTQSLNRNTPVIMLTANALAGVREEYIKEGFTDYLSKPVKSDEPEKMIERLLPPELVSTQIEETPEEGTVAENGLSLSALKKVLPELDSTAALEYCCQSVDFFFEVLRDYAYNGRYDELETAFRAENFDDYRRAAHSLKSSSLTIGLADLSEIAKKIELALKEGNVLYAKEHHFELMQNFDYVLTKLHLFFDEN